MIFGRDNVIDARMCFGKDAKRQTQNFVYHLRHKMTETEALAVARDLARGERLLNLVLKRNRRPLPKFLRSSHGGEGPEAA